jgi:iron complex outermembrane receptor protein
MRAHPLAVAVGLALTGPAVQAADDPVYHADELVITDQAPPAPDIHYTSPTTRIDARQAQSINTTTIEDYIKYEPSLVVRRRYIGDPNGTLGMRGSNMFQTTHAMVYADGLLLHYFLQSSYNGAPRWSLVAPDETESVEVVYGPFSAEYPGNAMGGVVNIHTRMPTQREFHFDTSLFAQDYSYLNTKGPTRATASSSPSATASVPCRSTPSTTACATTASR